VGVAPRYLMLDRDAVYGDSSSAPRAMSIRDRPTARDRRGRTDIVKGAIVRSGGMS